MGEYSCSLSAHDGNVLGQCAQSSTHPSVLRRKVRRERWRQANQSANDVAQSKNPRHLLQSMRSEENQRNHSRRLWWTIDCGIVVLYAHYSSVLRPAPGRSRSYGRISNSTCTAGRWLNRRLNPVGSRLKRQECSMGPIKV